MAILIFCVQSNWDLEQLSHETDFKSLTQVNWTNYFLHKYFKLENVSIGHHDPHIILFPCQENCKIYVKLPQTKFLNLIKSGWMIREANGQRKESVRMKRWNDK